jgi:8-oxo-dGTP pyrophosphatase MutT (NUDIX family)
MSVVEAIAEMAPVPAATVTLVRDGKHGLEVLMMQRNLQSLFVPGNYVFPGGAVDEQDAAPDASDLCAGLDDAQASAALGIACGGLAYWIAAIRESFEEAGLLLAYAPGGDIVELVRGDVIERFSVHRQAVDEGARSLAAIVREEGLRIAADQLAYFSHWITPVGAPRRYDTRFFVAEAPPAQASLHDNRETISHVWLPPGAALDQHRAGGFKMRLPTVRTLEQFASFDHAASLLEAMRAQRNVPAILPRLSKDGRRLLPGDAGYEEAVGAGAGDKWQ